MKMITLCLAILIAGSAHAGFGYNELPQILSSLEGYYEGNYGTFRKKPCTVKLEFMGDVTNGIPEGVLLTLKHTNRIGTEEIHPGAFFALVYNNNVTDRKFFNLKFNYSHSFTLKSFHLYSHKLRCENLVKRIKD